MSKPVQKLTKSLLLFALAFVFTWSQLVTIGASGFPGAPGLGGPLHTGDDEDDDAVGGEGFGGGAFDEEEEEAANLGKLTLYKYIQSEAVNNNVSGSATDEKPAVDATKKLAKGVAYKLIQTHSFEGKATKDGPILGKFVALQTPVTMILVTDAEGKVEKTNLPLGRYTLQEFAEADYSKPEYANDLATNNPEKKMPAGLTPNTKEFTVEFPYSSEANKAKFELTVYPKNQWISGQIGIQKWLVKGGDETQKEAHKDVVYKLYTKETTEAAGETYVELVNSPLTGTAIGEIKTNEEGKATVTNLKAGETYYLLEVTADANGSIPRDLKMREVVAKPTTEELVNEEFINDKPVKEVSVNTTTYSHSETTQVEKELDYRIQVMTPKDTDVLTKFVIEDKFQEDVKAFVEFIKAENGTADAIKGFTVTIDNEDKTEAFDFAAIKNGDDIVGFTLTAKTPNTLPVAKKVLVTAKAKVKQSITTETTTTEFPNDVKQTITYTDPKNPTGDPITDSETDTSTVKIPRGGLVVQKFDIEKNNGAYSETDNFLNEAEFKLYSKSDYEANKDTAKVYATLTTADKGTAKAENLPIGDYVLVETKFPTVPANDPTYGGRSYVAVNEFTEVKILPYVDDNAANPYNLEEPALPSIALTEEENASNYALSSIPNTKPHWWLPFTGGNGIRMFTIGGVLLMTLSVGFAIAGKRRNEEAEA